MTLGRVGKKLSIIGLLPRLLSLTLRFRLCGIEAVSEKLVSYTIGLPQILAWFGARVGSGCVIHGPLIIHNAVRDYGNLVVGTKVHIGRSVLLDLTDRIVVGDESVVSMNCTLLTHQDVGDRISKLRHPRKAECLAIGPGAYLGAGVTVLAGCDIGARTTVGAGAVVTRPLPDDGVAVGVPVRVMTHHNE